MSSTLHWGVAASGRISHDFVKATQKYSSQQHEFIAVAARKLEDSSAFAKKFGIAQAYEGYEELAKDPNVDVVYVGNLHTQHYSTVRLMLENGKHVLCEKSFMLNLHQTKDIFKLAKEKNLFCMEALWTRFHPAYARLGALIKDGEIGQVRHIRADFGKDTQHVARVCQKELGGSVLMDMGVYCVQLGTLLKDEYPAEVKAVGELYESGVDKSCCASLRYEDGTLFQFSTHSALALSNSADIIGTKGTVHIPQFFHVPVELIVNGKTESFPVPQDDFNFANSAALCHEADAVYEALRAGHLEHELNSHRHTEISMAIMDECRRQMGVRFDCELPASG